MELTNHEVKSWTSSNEQAKNESKRDDLRVLLGTWGQIQGLHIWCPSICHIYLFKEFASSDPPFHVSQLKCLSIMKLSKAAIATLL